MSDSNNTATCRTCRSNFHPALWQIKKSDYQCKSCRRKNQNNRNAADLMFSEKRRIRNSLTHVKKSRTEYWKKVKNDPQKRAKRRCRRLTDMAILRGEIKKNCCQSCGSEKSEIHHNDYTNPYDINWYCRKCHYKIEHRKEAMIAESEKG